MNSMNKYMERTRFSHLFLVTRTLSLSFCVGDNDNTVNCDKYRSLLALSLSGATAKATNPNLNVVYCAFKFIFVFSNDF